MINWPLPHPGAADENDLTAKSDTTKELCMNIAASTLQPPLFTGLRLFPVFVSIKPWL